LEAILAEFSLDFSDFLNEQWHQKKKPKNGCEKVPRIRLGSCSQEMPHRNQEGNVFCNKACANKHEVNTEQECEVRKAVCTTCNERKEVDASFSKMTSKQVDNHFNNKQALVCDECVQRKATVKAPYLRTCASCSQEIPHRNLEGNVFCNKACANKHSKKTAKNGKK